MQPGARLLLAGLLALWVQLIPRSAQDHQETCRLPSDPGPCDGYFRRYFYSSEYKRCEKFIYGGCGGNKNNFETLKECLHTCTEKPGNCPRVPPGFSIPCDVKCHLDWDCPGPEKCCHLGCRSVCYRP